MFIRYVLAAVVFLSLAWGLFGLPGKQYKEGGGCSVFKPCANGMTCEAWHHKCRKPGKEGDSCHATKPCGPGLTCEAWHHKCRKPGKEGDSCHATRPCGPGLTCEAGSHKCRKPGQEGDSCHATRPCGDGLYCLSVQHKCRRMGNVGEKCVSWFIGYEGRKCNHQKDYWCDPFSRTCLPPSGRGNICGYLGEKEDAGQCEKGLECNCDVGCSIGKFLKDLQGSLSGVAQTIQDLIGKKKFCCKCE